MLKVKGKKKKHKGKMENEKKKLQDLTHSQPLNSSCNSVMCTMTAECVGAEREAQRWLKFHNSEHDCGSPIFFWLLHWELKNSSQAVCKVNAFSPWATCLLEWLTAKISSVLWGVGSLIPSLSPAEAETEARWAADSEQLLEMISTKPKASLRQCK